MYNRVLFIGSKDSGLRVLKLMHAISPNTLIGCVTVDDSLDTRSELKNIIDYCNANHIPIEILNGRCDLHNVIEVYRPDLCIVMGWYYIISDDILGAVKGGFIGIHNSLLPKHRGFAPLVWSIIEGETETGFSVFSLDGGMDTGKIWHQGTITIEPEDYIADVITKIDSGIEKFFENDYRDILEGRKQPHDQTSEGISYGARRGELDGIINWKWEATRIYDFIRAQSKPYPGAFSTYKGETVRIWNSRVFPYRIQGRPGQIGLIDGDEVVVVSGHNTGIVLNQIEVDGQEMKSKDFIRGLSEGFV